MCKVCEEKEKETRLTGYLLHVIKALLGSSELFLRLRMTMNLKSCKTPKPMQLKECLASSLMGELSTELCPAGRRRSAGLCLGDGADRSQDTTRTSGPEGRWAIWWTSVSASEGTQKRR